MKHAVQKKPKTFRTLIRKSRSGNREAPNEDKSVNIVDNAVKQVENAGKERRKQPFSFFGR
ncbi:hypothetical protein [Dehalobacter sp. TeCB1]|uniref:hypothetical protein n=1 Tax=Dehalobacter sp. TeCB1 TaxID=1843715 RepID=UPI00114735A0|nr:hypothetical protein [Dehalobacter sp. TeCB1]